MSDPYVYLRGVTEVRQRAYIKKGDRACMKIAVALIPGVNRVVVKAVSGSSPNSGHEPSKKYRRTDGKIASGFTSSEYCDFLREVLAACPRRRPMVLHHDRDITHHTSEVSALLEEYGVTEIVMPPHSPDVDPLDYCVFGHTKAALRKIRQASFGARCDLFIRMLEDLDARVQTEGFKTRISMLIAAKGYHIEK